jgi:hypothetical protein
VSWLLSEAVVRVQVRRALAVVRRSPAPVVALAVTWLASPVIVAWGMAPIGDVLAPALTDAGVVRALLTGLALPAAAMGSALALSLGGIAALGLQIATAPVRRRALVTATFLPTLVGAGLLVTPTAIALTFPLVEPSPGGPAACVPLAATLTAAAAAGGLAAEAVLRSVRGRRLAPLTVAAGAVVALALLLELLARAVAGGGAAASAAAAAAAIPLAVASALGWVELASRRPPVRPHAPRRRGCSVSLSAAPATVHIAAVVLLRRQEVRLALVAAAMFGVLGGAVGAGAPGGGAVAALLGGGSAVFAASLAPLAAGGRIESGYWAWRAGGCATTAAGWAAASSALVACAVVPAAVLGLGLGATPRVLPSLLALAVLACGAALAVGALLPRRSPCAFDDAASLAMLGTLAVVLAAVLSFLQGRLEAIGVPGAVAAVALLAAVGALGVVALATTARRRA